MSLEIPKELKRKELNETLFTKAFQVASHSLIPFSRFVKRIGSKRTFHLWIFCSLWSFINSFFSVVKKYI
ncbi:hypothetical protein AYB33_09975 [Leptospira santarosai]|uniref:Uncharacterized protein n=1 Tax=Leptospira santarosai serovar Arenal str. MAVJ 401 TaxID=1049976 RepID=M6JWD3_9LEPT|nr:hypothetical protein LEP1GSC063_2135 [Leptospira santarosai serovar Arenal str. MAVJ 401]KXZ24533.1 hypothetical protein AYB33_09975 [Leptospira santarosai]